MKTEKCNEVMNRYLMLDKGQKVPLGLSLHILGCKKCRTQIAMLKKAESIAARPLTIQAPVTDSVIQNVLQQLPSLPKEEKNFKPLPAVGWIIGGIIMIALLAFSISTISDLNSRSLSISYALMIAGAITTYCAVFVFSNTDAFIKKISTVVTSIATQG